MTGQVEKMEEKTTAIFHWRVEAFSSPYSMSAREYFLSLTRYLRRGHVSPPFRFGGQRWCMSLSPTYGKSDLEFSLRLIDGVPVQVRFSVGISTATGETEVRGDRWKTLTPFPCSHDFQFRLIEISELFLRRDELLPQKILTIALKMEVEGGSPGTDSFDPDLENLSLDLSELLEQQVLPDVKLKCPERTFSAHRAVLAARSEVFADMFRHDAAESEKTGVVDIPDLDAPVLEHFLRCVYTGKIQFLPGDVLPGVYAACDKYAVPSLKKACSDRMMADLSEGNCISFLTVAHAHGDAPFKDAVVSFICGREAIFRSKAWLSFQEDRKDLAIEVYGSYFR